MKEDFRVLNRKGFTLIELLVVISIIALLLAILMPALGKVKEKAGQIICRSNQRQAMISSITYSVDNNGYNLPSWATRGQAWYVFLESYIQSTSDMISCPQARKPLEDAYHGSANGAMGAAKNSWIVYAEDIPGGYGYNNWLENDYGGGGKGILKHADAKRPAETPAFADCVWGDIGWILESDIIPDEEYWDDPILAPESGTGAWGNLLSRITLSRHGDSINVTMMDGHGEGVKVADLLGLRWHRTWDREAARATP